MLVDDLRNLYKELGGIDDKPYWTKYDYWREIAKINNVDTSNLVNINEVLEKLEGVLE